MSLGAHQLVTIRLLRIRRIYIHDFSIEYRQKIRYRKRAADMAETTGLDALYRTDPDLQGKLLELFDLFLCHLFPPLHIA